MNSLLIFVLSLALVTSHVNAQASNNRERVTKGLEWLLSRRLPNKGWDNQNTGRAVLALQLANAAKGRWTEYGGVEAKLSIKQMENEVLAALARDRGMTTFDDATLLSYFGAMISTCYDLRNFYGHDLIRVLEGRMKNFNNLLQYSLGVVTLCNAGERVKDAQIGTMLSQLRNLIRPNCIFCDEMVSGVILALTCARSQLNQRNNVLDQAISNNVALLKRSQNADGGFKNTYATSLAIQALHAAEASTPEDTDRVYQYLYKEQKKETGSFVNVFIATVVLPAIGGSHHLSIGRTDCPPKGVLVPDVGPGMIFVRYRVEDGVRNAFNISGSVAVPQGTTAHQIMNSLSIESPGSFQYAVEDIPGPFRQIVVKELNGLQSNPQRRFIWNIYKQAVNAQPVRMNNGVAMVPGNNELVILRYERT